MKIIKLNMLLLFLLFPIFSIASETSSINIDETNLFNEKLNESDKEILSKGGVLIRSISKISKLCVKNEGMPSLVINPMSKKIKSGYIAEIVHFKKYEGNEDLIERINKVMSDFLSYTDIPYYSEHNKKWQKLYESAEIKDIKTKDNKTTIDEVLEMDLFGKFTSQINIENYDSYFIYKLMNTDKLKFHGWLTVIKPEEMRSVVAVFRIKDNWMIYAIGSANAVRLPFLSSIAEQEFTGRIKAFADFIFNKIDISGNKIESKIEKKLEED